MPGKENYYPPVEYITTPEYSGSMDESIAGIINLPISGKRALNPNDKKRRITRKDVAKMATDIARSKDAEQYLSGNISLGGNKSRQRLFDRSFNQEMERQQTEELLEKAGLKDEIVVDRGFSPEESMKIATSFRKRPLTGHIGAGLGQNLGDQELLDIAALGISAPILMTNPVTTTIVDDLLIPGARKAVQYTDDAVNWLGKTNGKWWDPRHIGQSFLDPTKAYTGLGQAAFATADAYGAYQSYDANKHLINKWKNKDFHHSDVPKFALNTLGMIPGVKYVSDFIPAFGKALSWAADDTVRAFNNMVSGTEPVYGIRPELPGTRWSSEMLSDLRSSVPSTPTSTVTQTNVAPRPEQYGRLQRDVVSQLNRIGLGRYDIQGLLDRGFSPEEILRLTDTRTPGLTSNRRAQALGQRLLNMGITPTRPTRMAYLQSVVDNGGTLLEYRNRPYSIEEWNEIPETADLDPLDHEWGTDTDWLRNIFYGSQMTPSRPHFQTTHSAPITVSPEEGAIDLLSSSDEFSNLRNKLRSSLEVFGEEEYQTALPEIRRILIEGINSGKSASQIETELDALYESYNKPFGIDLSSISYGRATASMGTPQTWNLKDAILQGTRGSKGNSSIRRTEYPTVDDISPVVTPEDQIYGVGSFSIFDAPGSDVARLHKTVMGRLPHGAITYDVHKSMQSMPMASRAYTKLIQEGRGIGTFLPSGFDWDTHYGDGYRRLSKYLPTDDGYYYRRSNNFAGTRWHPRRGVGDEYTPGINAQTARELLDDNVVMFEEYLNALNPKVFSAMGGYPKYGIEIDGTFYDLPIKKGIRADGTPGLIIEQSEDLAKAVDNFDQNNESILKTADSWNAFKTKTQYLIEGFHPDGHEARLEQNVRGVWGIRGKDGSFVSLSTFAKSNPNFARRYLPVVTELNSSLSGRNLTFEQLDALRGTGDDRVYMHGPVQAVRVKENGGILNNLNTNSKKLLGVW